MLSMGLVIHWDDLDECYLEVHRSNMSKLGEWTTNEK